jgi:hypothetical protein
MTTFVDHITVVTALWLNSVDDIINTDAIAALSTVTPAAGYVPYFTGLAAASTTPLTTFARTVIDDSDAATMRATLGLVIGTNVQAYDAELAAIAGLISAADKLPYFTGSGTAALTTFTAAGRALVDDANAAEQLTTLGVSAYIQTLLDDANAAAAQTTLGISAFMQTILDDTDASAFFATVGMSGAYLPLAGGTMSGDITMGNKKLKTVKSINFNSVIDDGDSGAADTIDFTEGQYHKSTLTDDAVFTYVDPDGPCVVHHEIYQDGTGGFSAEFPASVKWPGGTPGIITMTAGARDLLVLRWDGTDYIANLVQDIG